MVVPPPGPVTAKLTASCGSAVMLPPRLPVRVTPAGASPARLVGALPTASAEVIDDGRYRSSPANEAVIG